MTDNSRLEEMKLSNDVISELVSASLPASSVVVMIPRLDFSGGVSIESKASNKRTSDNAELREENKSRKADNIDSGLEQGPSPLNPVTIGLITVKAANRLSSTKTDTLETEYKSEPPGADLKVCKESADLSLDAAHTTSPEDPDFAAMLLKISRLIFIRNFDICDDDVSTVLSQYYSSTSEEYKRYKDMLKGWRKIGRRKSGRLLVSEIFSYCSEIANKWCRESSDLAFDYATTADHRCGVGINCLDVVNATIIECRVREYQCLNESGVDLFPPGMINFVQDNVQQYNNRTTTTVHYSQLGDDQKTEFWEHGSRWNLATQEHLILPHFRWVIDTNALLKDEKWLLYFRSVYKVAVMAIYEHWIRPNLLSRLANAHQVYSQIRNYAATLERPSIDTIPLVSAEPPKKVCRHHPSKNYPDDTAKDEVRNIPVQGENSSDTVQGSKPLRTTKLERDRLAKEAVKQAEIEAAPRNMNAAANMALGGKKYSWMKGS